MRAGEFAIGESEERDRGIAEERESGARFRFACRGVASLRAICRHGHVHLPAFAQMQRHQTAATDHFIVRMRCQHEEAFAA